LLVDLGLLKTEHTPFAVQAWFQTESSWLGWRDRADQDFCSGQSGSLNQPRHLCLQPGGRGQEACRDEAQDLQAPAESPSTKPMRGIAADLHRAAAGDKVSKAAVAKTVSTAAKATGHDVADELTALGLTRTPSV
jgi:hypothetical protein